MKRKQPHIHLREIDEKISVNVILKICQHNSFLLISLASLYTTLLEVEIF